MKKSFFISFILHLAIFIGIILEKKEFSTSKTKITLKEIRLIGPFQKPKLKKEKKTNKNPVLKKINPPKKNKKPQQKAPKKKPLKNRKKKKIKKHISFTKKAPQTKKNPQKTTHLRKKKNFALQKSQKAFKKRNLKNNSLSGFLTKKTSQHSKPKPKTNYLFFAKKIKEAIQKNLYYPKIAKRLKKEGIVKIEFEVLATGVVKNLKVVRSSGSKLLDNAATKTILKAQKLFPKPSKKIKLTVPLQYLLKK